ncbi:MAG: agmatinase [Saprospiraceae bacterium]|nr:agmatinase [Saprospiraceae bacterium]
MTGKRTFGGIPADYAGFAEATVLLQPLLYDGTSTWGKGADQGYAAFLEATDNMELYDIETGTEVYRRGIHLLPPRTGFGSPEEMYRDTLNCTRELLATGKFLTCFGGEHSVSIGVIEAFDEHYPGLSVLQIDAHTDLRPEYLGSPYNHACALHAASQRGNLVQVGIRSMDASEVEYVQPDNCFYMHELRRDTYWMDRAVSRLHDPVYLTLDLDALDPSIMPATGTPEPGGLLWYELLAFLRKVFTEREVVGFDMVELAPVDGLHAPQFLAAKLYYKMLTYKFEL